MTVGNFTEGQAVLRCLVTLVPKVIEGVDEKLRSDVRLFFPPKSVDGFSTPLTLVYRTLAHADDESQLGQRRVEVIFLNLTLSSTSREVAVEERVPVLVDGDTRECFILPPGFLLHRTDDDAGHQFRFLPAVE